MPFFSKLHGVEVSKHKEFASRWDCEKWLQTFGYAQYIILPNNKHRIFRKISNEVRTHYARAIYDVKDWKWKPEYGVWPSDRLLIRVISTLYRENAIEILEWLKEHDNCIVNCAGGIVEPHIFSSSQLEDDKIIESWQVFSFQDRDFAAEFKLIWA